MFFCNKIAFRHISCQSNSAVELVNKNNPPPKIEFQLPSCLQVKNDIPIEMAVKAANFKQRCLRYLFDLFLACKERTINHFVLVCVCQNHTGNPALCNLVMEVFITSTPSWFSPKPLVSLNASVLLIESASVFLSTNKPYVFFKQRFFYKLNKVSHIVNYLFSSTPTHLGYSQIILSCYSKSFSKFLLYIYSHQMK